MSIQTEGATAAKRRGQAVAGALAGVAVVVVLVGVFIGVKASDDDKPAAAAPLPALSEPAAAQPTPEAASPAAPAPSEPAQAAPAPVDTPAALSKQPVVKGGPGTLQKLAVTPLVPGKGPVVQKGQTITANYVLVSYKTGETIDSSWSRGEPFSVQIGTGAVIQGWDQGIPGQKVGSRIQLDVPAALAYGAQQGDLRFVVDILAAK